MMLLQPALITRAGCSVSPSVWYRVEHAAGLGMNATGFCFLRLWWEGKLGKTRKMGFFNVAGTGWRAGKVLMFRRKQPK